LVNGVKDGDEIQSINYFGLIPILVNEMKNIKKDMNNFNEDLEIFKEEINVFENYNIK